MNFKQILKIVWVAKSCLFVQLTIIDLILDTIMIGGDLVLDTIGGECQHYL